VLRYAFELARTRERKHVTVATKSNGIAVSMPWWDECADAMAQSYPDITHDKQHIDILTARFVLQPQRFDVVVASNLFGDILSDLAAVLAGGMGMAPSANILPGGDVPGVYEPVHGSAPDIAGRGIANPTACLLSGALLLEDLGHVKAADGIRRAVGAALEDPAHHTPDLGGDATTSQLAAAVLHRMETP
jgi:tartrate dehydrogenase/decarboxylase/D-malate dehydrogenase